MSTPGGQPGEDPRLSSRMVSATTEKSTMVSTLVAALSAVLNRKKSLPRVAGQRVVATNKTCIGTKHEHKINCKLRVSLQSIATSASLPAINRFGERTQPCELVMDVFQLSVRPDASTATADRVVGGSSCPTRTRSFYTRFACRSVMRWTAGLPRAEFRPPRDHGNFVFEGHGARTRMS